MSKPAIVEQQAKLGVSAEKSKAQRLQRQQARFRNRGGAFIPSNSNPLVDILLARTVSGESPSKARPRDIPINCPSTSTRQAGVVIASDTSGAAAGGSKSSLPASQERRGKAVELETNTTVDTTPKRRGRPVKGKKKIDSDAEQPPPKVRSKSVLKAKGKRTASSTGESSASKLKVKSKLNPAKKVVETIVSDDDQTLVEVPRKAKSKSRRTGQCKDDGHSDNDVPVIEERLLPLMNDTGTSGAKSATNVEVGEIVAMVNSGKRMEGEETVVQHEKSLKTNARKRLGPYDDDDDVTAPIFKKSKAAKSTSTKSKSAEDNVNNDESSKAAAHRKRKSKSEPDHIEPTQVEVKARASKPKKRKEDQCDDRHRKASKFSDPGSYHSSSLKLKENQHDTDHGEFTKSTDPLPPQQTKKPSSRLKGPPREVLDRIKASAARHLQSADSEPDELDCLS